MAVRNEARILTALWSDPDWLARSPDAQWLYLALLSQPNLGFAGIIATTRSRWASYAKGLTPARLARASRELADSQFLVVDDLSEETLVRTFIRNDGVWKQPKLLRIAIREALSCTSAKIKETIGIELARCEPDELSDAPTMVLQPDGSRAKTGPSIQSQFVELVQDAIPLLISNNHAGPSLGPSRGPSARASIHPLPGALGVRARVHAAPNP